MWISGLPVRALSAFATAMILAACGGATPSSKAEVALDRALALEQAHKPDEALTAFFAAIETDPDFAPAHGALATFEDTQRKAPASSDEERARAKQIQTTIDDRYSQWERQFPQSTGILLGMGTRLFNKEDPRARAFLLKVIARDPNNADAYAMLSNDADVRGDWAAASEYMQKAVTLEPANPDYAFYYANTLGHLAPEKWEAASRDVARRFPQSERGAQALYWLGQKAEQDGKRIEVWEQLRRQFPPQKFRWTRSAMPDLFEAYLRVAPALAVRFAASMQQQAPAAEQWAAREEMARAYVNVAQKLAAGESADAVNLLDRLTPAHRSGNGAMLTRFKAQALASAGRMQESYRTLLEWQAKVPDGTTGIALEREGARLGKTPDQIKSELIALRIAAARQAPDFSLQPYTSVKNVSLSDYRGKVVLLSFWFPGCGPCRAEFPRLEAAARAYHGTDLVYIGVNGVPEQDDFVLPLIRKSDWTFTPLKGTAAVTGPAGYNVRGYPTNFLIDRSGRIVYSGFTADSEESQRVVEHMIASLL